MKRISVLMLLAAMLVSMAACQNDTTGETTAVPDPANTTVADTETETSPYVADALPALDYGGRTATFYIGDYKNAFWNDFYAESSTGERLNDAIYDSIQTMNERLNVVLSHTQDTFDYPGTDHVNRITSGIIAGDNSYDVLYSSLNFIGEQLTSAYFANLAEVPHVDLSKPWYNQSIPEALPGDNVWFMIGDAELGNIKHTFCVYFNSDLLEANGIDSDLYSMVDNGTWTLDAFSTIAAQGYMDANGNEEQDPDDTYGLTFGDANKLLGFISSLDVKIVSKTNSGYTVEFGNERVINSIEALNSLIHSNDSVAPIDGNNADHPEWQVATGGGNYASTSFITGKSLLSCSLICDAVTIMPEIDFNCGILPYPKYDTEQQNYQSFLQRSCYSLIPTTADLEFSGALLEAWSSQAYRKLTPEYYETVLKTRYSQDINCSRMFDLIRGSITYDPGEIFNIFLGSPSNAFKETIKANKSNWASQIKSNEKKWQTSLDELWDTLTNPVE